MSDETYEDEIHLAWRGALKACGVGDADRDAITDVVRSMLAERSAPAQGGVTDSEVASFIELTRKVCKEAEKSPGKPIPIPDALRSEYLKFMADQPSIFDRIPWGEFKHLTGTNAALAGQAKSAGGGEALEIVGWEYRHLDTSNTPNRWSNWERCRARNVHTSTDEDFKNEIQAYIELGYRYELRTLYAAPIPAAPAQTEGDAS